jgi:hypothetical protein
MWKELQWRIGTAWCIATHKSVMWPVHGHFQCRTCGRRYPAFAEAPAANWPKRVAWKPVVSLVLTLAFAVLARPAHAAMLTGSVNAQASAALEKYLVAGPPAPWTVESIEIHASLAKFETSGELRAIRRPAPVGESPYEVLQLAGDRRVEQQVIVRYLNAEEQASEMPAASTAITRANYKFTYNGAVDDGQHLAYAFKITPRHKRQGLIRGEIWLDQQSGVPVVQFGRLVKSPSMFIGRVSVVRENTLCDGAVASRLTHITVQTRLFGRAELVVEERPLSLEDAVQLTNLNTKGGQQ